MCGAIGSLKSTYAGSFIFHLHRKFLFLDFVARKRNIFSWPANRPPPQKKNTHLYSPADADLFWRGAPSTLYPPSQNSPMIKETRYCKYRIPVYRHHVCYLDTQQKRKSIRCETIALARHQTIIAHVITKQGLKLIGCQVANWDQILYLHACDQIFHAKQFRSLKITQVFHSFNFSAV